MSYTVLARKYRSQSFDDIVGQDAIAKTLKNAIKTGRVAHAYMFSGTRGVGKTTMARILAKALNCHGSDGPTTEPCCKCDSCTAINVGEDLDVIEIDGASNNSVDEVRRLRENAIYRPARSRFKIYIIDEVHMLSTSAFNALLKILEEPPSHVKFIFATTEPNKVIATIQSRCQRFDFSNINPAAIAGQLESILKQEKIKYEKDLTLPLARMANGSMRDGLSLLDRLISTGEQPLSMKMLEEYLGCPNSEKIYNFLAEIANSDAAAVLNALDDLISVGMDESQVVDALIECMRDLMVIKAAGTESGLLILSGEQRKTAGQLAEKFDTAAIVYNITALEKLRFSVRNSDTPRALLEASFLRLALSEHFLNVDTLISRFNNQSSGRIKKKQINSSNTVAEADNETDPEGDGQLNLSLSDDLRSVQDNWQNILKAISSRAGNGTAGLLGTAKPSGFENDCLTITFPASAQVSKEMCESNDRSEQIRSLISQYYKRPIALKFEMAVDETAAGDSKTPSQRRKEIMNDPAVKTILMELGATITGID